ncbi:MAG TPA: cyclic nucleotide-binding domain-containing protein [bacterium]
MIKTIEALLKEHPFFKGIKPPFLKLIAGCAVNVRFGKGKYLFHEGTKAKRFYIIRSGTVALEICGHGKMCITVQHLGEGEVLGWSWLFPPYRWTATARVIMPASAIALDGECLRKKCEKNHDLGYELMKRFVQIVNQRLAHSRMQLIDMYGTGH